MPRRALVVALSSLSLVPAVAAHAAPPPSPDQTGECVSGIAQTRMGPPAQPGISFPFQCPPPPGIQH